MGIWLKMVSKEWFKLSKINRQRSQHPFFSSSSSSFSFFLGGGFCGGGEGEVGCKLVVCVNSNLNVYN